MATPRHRGRGFRSGRRGFSFIEASLAISVIVGLLFVTMRIMNMPNPEPQTMVPGNGTGIVKTEPSPKAPQTSKTP